MRAAVSRVPSPHRTAHPRKGAMRCAPNPVAPCSTRHVLPACHRTTQKHPSTYTLNPSRCVILFCTQSEIPDAALEHFFQPPWPRGPAMSAVGMQSFFVSPEKSLPGLAGSEQRGVLPAQPHGAVFRYGLRRIPKRTEENVDPYQKREN